MNSQTGTYPACLFHHFLLFQGILILQDHPKMKGATILPLVVTKESNKGETNTPQPGQGKGEGSNKCVKNLH